MLQVSEGFDWPLHDIVYSAFIFHKEYVGERERRGRWKPARKKTEAASEAQGTGSLRRCSGRPLKDGDSEAESSGPDTMPGKAGKQTGSIWYIGNRGWNSTNTISVHKEIWRISHVIPGPKTHRDFSTAVWLPDYLWHLDFVDGKYSFSWNWETWLKFLLPSQVGKINQYKL